MNNELGFLAALLTVVAVGAWVRYQGRQRARRAAGARALGWEPAVEPGLLKSRWMRDMTLTRIGHSRRIESVFQQPGPVFLFYYRCETGFEHRRNSHRWMAIAATIDARISRATISREDWLLAAARLPGMTRIAPGADADTTSPSAVVEDPEQWRTILSGPAGAWLGNQPEARSWEFLPGMIVGYEGASPGDAAIDALSQAMNELLATLGQAGSWEAASAFGAG